MKPVAPLPSCHLEKLVLLVAAFTVYSNSFHGVFLYDDVGAIQQNLSIRRLWPLTDVLFPAQNGGITTSGRPLVNLSFALNYAITGAGVGGYHAFNVLVHAAAALVLFGLLRRTLRHSLLPPRIVAEADWLALLSSLLWTAHPLNTQAVTYLVQRAEAMMAWAVLGALYAFVRSVEAESLVARRGWVALSIGSALAGVACKEVAAVIPLLVLLYDRTFVAGDFRRAGRERAGLYLGLVATWLPLAFLLASTGGDRGGTVGFTNGIPWGQFWLSQTEAIAVYLKLTVWPHPLVFDYGRDIAASAARAWPYVLLVLVLLGATVWALRRRPVLGFVGAWFFLLLAPTSAVPSSVQFIVEHRMYLPLTALCALGVVGAYWRWERKAIGVGCAAIALAGVLTYLRNVDYQSSERMWSDTVAKAPTNPVALSNLGNSREAAGDFRGAAELYQRAIQTAHPSGLAHYNLGNAFMRLGRPQDAIASYRQALVFDPNMAEYHLGLTVALVQSGQTAQARRVIERAIGRVPGIAPAHQIYGELLAASGETAAANRQFAQADLIWGRTLLGHGDPEEAARKLASALRLDPTLAAAHRHLGELRARQGRAAEATTHFEAALRLDPTDAGARDALSRLRARPAN